MGADPHMAPHGVDGFHPADDDLFVAVGCLLGRIADEEGRDLDTREPEALPWFRQGKHYKQLTMPSYEALARLAWPVSGRELAAQETTSAGAVKELLDDGLAVQLPASDEPAAWEHVFRLRVLPHSIGLGQARADRTRFAVISRAFPWLSEPESSEAGSLTLSGLDYFIWTTFDGTRSLGDVLKAVADRIGLSDFAVRARAPALLRALLIRGLVSLDLVIQPADEI